MSPKIVLFIAFVLLTTIEAHFLKKIAGSSAFVSKLSHKATEHLERRRRDVEEKASSESISEETGENLMKFFMAMAWESDKKEVLGGFLEEMSDSDNNLTVVAWQRVLNDKGHVEEIRTIQLVIPPKPLDDDAPNNIVEDDDDDDDDEALPHDEINELKEVFEPFGKLGIPVSVTFEHFDEEGKNNALIYLDKDELYSFGEGFAIYNKTSISSSAEVSEFIKSLKPAALGKPSVLKYDVDGHLLADQSHIRPQFSGSVIEEHEAPANILRESPEIIARISQQYPREQIPKQLSLHFNKAYPAYKWRVLVSPSYYHVTRDVSVTLTYDNFDFDENSYGSYLVYGANKMDNVP